MSLTQFAGTLLVFLFISINARAQQIPQCGDVIPHDGCVAIEYDRFRGTTSRTLKFQAVQQSDVLIAVTFISIKGDDGNGMNSVGVVFIREGIRSFVSNPTLHILADSKRYPIQMETLRADYPDRIMTRETYAGARAAEDLKAIANAKTLEMQFREIQFEFNDTMRRRLTSFSSFF